ncbi:uncharacterized protein LOC106011644 [Aplysia californica]|uniref:Uncharacterized protein LOC106011644 n=1 Tax=Aplysia californica TaxID=6500 RepID=A0ABM1VSS0_APLCA|nr:uncharacterized protein LOC106011644 [Aplysia californica]
MSARSSTERPPKHPGPTGLSLSKHASGSYVQRFKIQKERIKTLHSNSDDESQTKNSRVIDKLLPKINSIAREDTSVKKYTRSDTVKSIKLPGVSGGSAYSQAARRRQPVPVKTFHLRLNPEMSKSLSSLPSIPGSPSVDQSISPSSDREYEFKGTAFPAKHRYQKIAFQKTLHAEKTSADDLTLGASLGQNEKGKSNRFEGVYRNALPRRPHRHHPHHAGSSEPETARSLIDGEPPKSSSTLSHVRMRRYSKESSISDTRSEGNYLVAKKWKDDCDCLRCQMLRRQYKEGDEQYKLWGQYPCHRVDHAIRLDDD